MKYNFIADPPGTTFWHSHFHEMSADGLHGPLIVGDKPGTFPFHYDEERVILLTDEYGSTSWELEDWLSLPDANGGPRGDPTPSGGLLCLYNEKKDSPPPYSKGPTPTESPLELSPTSAASSCSRDSSGRGFRLDFEPGKVYRLRIIGGSILSPFVFSIDQHELQLVSADYSTLDGNTWVKGVPISVSSGFRTSYTFKLILLNLDRSTV